MPYFCCNYLIDKVLVIRMMMIFLFPPFVWQKREEGAPRDSALRCFTLLYGPPRSRLTSTHCAASSSSLEISDSGASKLSDVPLLMQEGRNLLPKIQTFPADKYNIHRRTNPLWHPEQMAERGELTFGSTNFPQKSPTSQVLKICTTENENCSALWTENTLPRADGWSGQAPNRAILMDPFLWIHFLLLPACHRFLLCLSLM